MNRRLRRIAPVPAGLTLAALYACTGLLVAPLFYLMTRIVPPNAPPFPYSGVTFVVAMPLLYAIMGLLMGYVGALLYNWIAGFTGGLQLEVDAL